MEDFDNIKLGQRIKQIRIAKGYSQEELCALIGDNIDPPSISRIENGKKAPNIQTLVKIIIALDSSPNEIFDYSHILNLKDLDKEIKKELKSLTADKKQLIYRMIKLIKEL